MSIFPLLFEFDQLKDRSGCFLLTLDKKIGPLYPSASRAQGIRFGPKCPRALTPQAVSQVCCMILYGIELYSIVCLLFHCIAWYIVFYSLYSALANYRLVHQVVL